MRISDWSSDVCSSDLPMHVETNFSADLSPMAGAWRNSREESPAGGMTSLGIHSVDALIHLCGRIARVDVRSISEEHTSELQSLIRISYSVFCFYYYTFFFFFFFFFSFFFFFFF